MSLALWNTFGPDFRENCRLWEHSSVPAIPWSDGWMAEATANPDLVQFGDRQLLFFRGTNGMDRIGFAVATFNPFTFRLLNDGLPIIAPEGKDVLDPAAVVFNGRLHVYYSQLDPDVVGLAVSDDGETFRNVGAIHEGRAPEVVVRDRKVWMLNQFSNGAGGYELRLFVSDDGQHFEPFCTEPVFAPAADGWDSLSVVTARVWDADGWTWMLYGGSHLFTDEPDAFGLARSKDLVHWERHPGNPIFGCGPFGALDGGAMWFPAIHFDGRSVTLLYEGCVGKGGWSNICHVCQATLQMPE